MHHDTSRRSSKIDKATISRPLSMSLSPTAIPMPDTRSPKEKVIDTIVSKMRLADIDANGVDLQHIRTLCENDVDEEGARIVQKAGGWSKFTLAQTKSFLSFQENSRTLVILREALNMDELRNGVRDIMAQGRDAEPKSNLTDFDGRPIGSTQYIPGNNLPETHRELSEQSVSLTPGETEIREAALTDDESDAYGDIMEDYIAEEDVIPNADIDIPATSKPLPKLSPHNAEVVAALSRVNNRTKTDFFKDDIRKDAMRLMRATTLLMRFRDIFAGRSYEQITSRLLEEGDVEILGGFEQFLEMAVQAGYLVVKKKKGQSGHVATAAGAALIQPFTAISTTRANRKDLDLLEEQLLENYARLRPTKESDRLRARIVKDIQRHLDYEYPTVGFLVELFGSGGNGLYFPGSDSDICAYYSTIPPIRTVDIRQLAKTLYRARWCRNVLCIAHAKVPVIKMIHSSTGLPVDISIENTIAIENTRLIRLYMILDARVKPLAFALKVWCKARCISHPEEGSLSSYSWTLMLIHYLQRTSPPVLPNLQPRDGDFEAFNHSYNGRLIECLYDENPTFQSSNTSMVSELFVGFFNYYASFDYDALVINLKPEFHPSSSSSGDWDEIAPLRKAEKGRADWERKSIAIEDPFIDDRNTAVGCSTHLASWTIDEIQRASRILRSGGSFADIVGFANA